MREDVFTELYRVHAPHVLRRARAMLGCDADAWEVVQDLFLALYARPSAFDGRSTMSTYLFSATTHACLNRIRNRRTRARLLATYARPSRAPAVRQTWRPCPPCTPSCAASTSPWRAWRSITTSTT
jgi:RNA polymerase sigma factor (sigma-70 family)